ncbi:type I secretion system permease/ATPase [Neorhizobium sp. NPDC001467]|uniref:type I secretion system permease/ATPase n=1 Tax=Neorhizobium sp. NPDC001467 TaxID=3390595 RepID=UPI003D09339F
MTSPGSPRALVASALSQTRYAFYGIAVLSAITNILMLTGPLFMMQVYDRVLTSRSVPTLVALTLLALGIYVFLGILEMMRSKILLQIGRRIDEELSAPTFDTVLRLPLGLSRNDGGSQPLRDLDQIRGFMSGSGPIAICDLPWMPLYIAILYAFHPYFGYAAVAGAILLMALTLSSEFLLREPTRKLSQMASRRSDLVEAGRRNAEPLHAMGMRTSYAGRFERLNRQFVEGQTVTSDLTSSFSAVSKIFRMALQSAILALGAWLVIQQLASPGAIIASSILTSKALSPIEMVIGQWRGFINARQSRRRLEEMLDRHAGVRNPMPLPAPARTLSVAGLAIMPAGGSKPLIHDIAFTLSAGQGLGIIGHSGSGKSTLSRALVGIWPATRGSIRLDGAALNQWDPEALGPSIGYLPQGVDLFNGTIAENISRFSENASPDLIIEAAKLAGVHDLVLSMPDGYDTAIGNHGAILSSGQRQRIGLARALYGRPFLVVLDEPNANLDADGEAALTRAITAMRQAGSIVIVVAHRPNALQALDQVLVMSGGAMVAFGPRDEVLRKTTRPTPPRPAASAGASGGVAAGTQGLREETAKSEQAAVPFPAAEQEASDAAVLEEDQSKGSGPAVRRITR